jgi:hypothetical protein
MKGSSPNLIAGKSLLPKKRTRRREGTQRGRLPQPKTPQVKDRIFNRDGQDEQDGIEF